MRILFVAMQESIHTARWVNQLAGQGWDVHLFGTHEAEPHPQLRGVTCYGFAPYGGKLRGGPVRRRVLWPLPFAGRYAYLAASTFGPLYFRRAKWLAWLIRRLKPDLVHSLEFQHGAYLAMEARQILGGQFPPWIVTNWGSDIYLFGRLAEHAGKIRAILGAADYYSCECHRDVSLARGFGFKGEVWPVQPVAGGYDLDRAAQLRQPGPTSARRVVVLKGYQGWAGRALVGLRAVELCADVLRDYTIAIPGAYDVTRMAAELTAQATGLNIECVPPCSHEDMMRLHGRARVSLGLSISDAISTSLLEAMLMGSFPIQSHTACADEWLRHGESGWLVHPEDPAPLADALRRALTDDALVDRAAEMNAAVARERLDAEAIRARVISTYKRVAGQEAARRAGSVK